MYDLPQGVTQSDIDYAFSDYGARQSSCVCDGYGYLIVYTDSGYRAEPCPRNCTARRMNKYIIPPTPKPEPRRRKPRTPKGDSQ